MEICVHPEKLGKLLDEVSRYRALTEEESVMLEQIVCRGHQSAGIRMRWTDEHDRELLAAADCPGAIQLMADRIGTTRMAAYKRLQKLRSMACG